VGIAKRVTLMRAQGGYVPKALLDFFMPWRRVMRDDETMDCDADSCLSGEGSKETCSRNSYPEGCVYDPRRHLHPTRRARALRRTDRRKFPGPGRSYPIAEQINRVPEDVLALVASTLATLATYRNSLRAALKAEHAGIAGAGRQVARRFGRSRLIAALPVLRHFVRQGRPWDIDPYAVLRHLMPCPSEPEPETCPECHGKGYLTQARELCGSCLGTGKANRPGPDDEPERRDATDTVEILSANDERFKPGRRVVGNPATWRPDDHGGRRAWQDVGVVIGRIETGSVEVRWDNGRRVHPEVELEPVDDSVPPFGGDTGRPTPIMGLRDGMLVQVVPGMPGVPDPQCGGLERGSFAWWMLGLDRALVAGRLDATSLRLLKHTLDGGQWTDREPIGRSETRRMTTVERTTLGTLVDRLAESLEPPSLDIYEDREPIEGHGIPEVLGTPNYAPEPIAEKPKRNPRPKATAEAPTIPDAPAPANPHGNDVPGAPDASTAPGGPIYPPEVQDRSGASQRRPGRRSRTMPGQGSLFD
jgi:hypothetical protein